MKSTKYSKFCLIIFGPFYSWYNKKSLEEKNLHIVKANILMSYEEYYSIALMNIFIGLNISIVFSLFFYLLIPSLFVLILLPLIVTSIIAMTYYYYPTFLINNRGYTISLVQHGSHTARNKNMNMPIVCIQLTVVPNAMMIWNNDAHVLINTCPACGNFVVPFQ